MNGIYLRKAMREDAELLFSWANDIDVRRNSFHPQDIRWEEHIQWFEEKLQAEGCVIYIACEKLTEASEYISGLGMPGEDVISKKQISMEAPVGQIRLDICNGTAEIDYSVAAEKRGEGYGSEMLRLAQKVAPECVKEFYAQVKVKNAASARVFEKCGFERTKSSEAVLEYRKVRRKEDFIEKKKIVICTQKSWNVRLAEELRERYDGIYDISVITEKEKLKAEYLEEIKPAYIFIPHWSYIIPESVFGAYTCVVFHMTDLPFGRGGSPLQNLIVRGITHTKISALHVDRGLDTGDIYRKEELSLEGTADEILERASEIIFRKMIPYILENDPVPVPQSGEPVTFKRRKPEDGRLLPGMDLKTIYDYIRMLDGEGYPNAYMELGDMCLRFQAAHFEGGRVTAQVVFEKKVQ